MRVRVSKSARFVAAAALLAGMTVLCTSAKPRPATAAAPKKPNVFRILDNLSYKGKPDLTPLGLVRCNIIYQGAIWKGGKAGVMPDEQAYKEVVRKHYAIPGSAIVLDIEDSNNYKNFVTLAKWTHEAAPGSMVGFYGHGTETKELAKAVDAFFPSMYTFDDNRAGWKSKLERFIKQARAIAPGKPIYPYLWPQYHRASAKSWQFVNGDYWLFQLRTARDCGANGVVLWGASRLRGVAQPAWNANAPWWKSTQKFVAELQQSNP